MRQPRILRLRRARRNADLTRRTTTPRKPSLRVRMVRMVCRLMGHPLMAMYGYDGLVVCSCGGSYPI